MPPPYTKCRLCDNTIEDMMDGYSRAAREAALVMAHSVVCRAHADAAIATANGDIVYAILSLQDAIDAAGK